MKAFAELAKFERVRLVYALILLAILGRWGLGLAHADTTYEYFGQPFSPSQCTPGQGEICISGPVVEAATFHNLPADYTGTVYAGSSGQGPSVVSASMQAVGFTGALGNAVSCIDGFHGSASYTFSQGNIISWITQSGLYNNSKCQTQVGTVASQYSLFNTFDNAEQNGQPGQFGQNLNSPGSWRLALPADKLSGGANVCNCMVPDPVSVNTGNVFEEAADYTTSGPNPLAFTRYYNSMGSPASLAVSLGRNWRTNYDRYLQFMYTGSLPGTVMAERADGQVLQFNLVDGVWVTDTDIDATLVQSGTTWTLTDATDTVETYTQISASTALVGSIRARGGYTQTLSYNATNQLNTVTDSFNRTLSFNYAGTLLMSVTAFDGAITFGFTPVVVNGAAANVLTSVGYPTMPATSIAYQYGNLAFPTALTGMIDEDGNPYVSWTYDSTGRALTSQHAGGADLNTIIYNDTDNSRMVTNPLGVQDLYKLTTLQGVLKVIEIDRQATTTTAAATEMFTYDPNGYLASRTDWVGNLTTYVNDARGLPMTVTEAVGTSIARTTTTTWDAVFRVPDVVQTTGLKTTFTYDSLGNRTARKDKAGSVVRKWTYDWNQTGQLMTVIGPRTDVKQKTSFRYGAFGALRSVTDAVGHKTLITLSTNGGLPLTVVDPNGVTTQFTYDGRQRLLTSALSTTAGMLTTQVTYDPAGNTTSVELPDGSYLNNAYDMAHRLTAIADPLTDMISYTLDALGDRTGTLVGKASGKATWQDSAMFDALGRMIMDVRGAGQTSHFSYDANGALLTTIDPLSHVSSQTIDAVGRVSQTVDPAGTATSFTYDSHDRVTKVVGPPNLAATIYKYDGFGRLIQRTSPDTGVTNFNYDLADNLVQSTDASGVVTDYSYDALNRPLSVTYPADPAENVVYTYDEPGHGFGVGRLTSVTDAAGSLSMAYDERGNDLGETRIHNGITLATAYSYDAASRVAAITYPSGNQALYTRDQAGQIIAINALRPGATLTIPIASGISYQAFGPLSTLTYGNGMVDSRLYDLSYRVSALTDGNAQNLGYKYDAADNVKTIMDAVTPANTQTFRYDSLNRLKSASGAYGSYSWTYDTAGNRRTETPGVGSASTYSYQPASNVLTSIVTGSTTTTVNTTPAGNVMTLSASDGSLTSMTFNQAERLSTVTVGGTQVGSYTYDAFGHRFAKTSSLGNSLFQYDLAGHLLEETDNAGQLKTDTIYLGSVPVADLTASSTYSLYTDHLGTPQLAANTAQVASWSTLYLPFGTATSTQGTLVQNLRFPGQYDDAESGMYQNAFRDYVPAWGRYLESDPIGLAAGINTYFYVGGNPLVRIDRSGLEELPGPSDQISEAAHVALSLFDPVNELGQWRSILNLNYYNPGYYGNAANFSNLPGTVSALKLASGFLNGVGKFGGAALAVNAVQTAYACPNAENIGKAAVSVVGAAAGLIAEAPVEVGAGTFLLGFGLGESIVNGALPLFTSAVTR
jgi:RHS repeat-associated protein